MSRGWRVGVAVLGWATAGLVGAGSVWAQDEPPRASARAATLEELVAAHNRVRREHELPELTVNAKLGVAAERHARDMAAHEKMAHEGSDGSTPDQRVKAAGYRGQTTGENVAVGYRTVDALMKGWMDSPPHRKNILGDFTQIGVARVEGDDGQPYWAAEFGTPWPEPDPAAARQDLLEAVNAERAKAKLGALKVAPKLAAAAQRHAEDNAAREELAKTDQDGQGPLERVEASGYRYRRIGLADASGQPTAADVVATWVADERNAASLRGGFHDVGIGYARDATGKPYWTLILGEPRR